MTLLTMDLTVRRVDAEEGLAVGADDFAQRGDARGGVARGELHLARPVRVEQLQVARDLVGPRVGRGHHAHVDLEHLPH